MALDPCKRLSSTEALAHPYFTTSPPPADYSSLPLPPQKQRTAAEAGAAAEGRGGGGAGGGGGANKFTGIAASVLAGRLAAEPLAQNGQRSGGDEPAAKRQAVEMAGLGGMMAGGMSPRAA